MDLKKCWGVEQCLGGMPTNFVYGFEKKFFFFWGEGGGYAQIFHRLEKCWGGVCQQIYGLEKCLGGGGVMPKYFRDLKKSVGGGGYAQIF